MKDSVQGVVSAETLIAGTDQQGKLWTAAAAREMVAMISDDAENGVIPLAEAMRLINNVWERVG